MSCQNDANPASWKKRTHGWKEPPQTTNYQTTKPPNPGASFSRSLSATASNARAVSFLAETNLGTDGGKTQLVPESLNKET